MSRIETITFDGDDTLWHTQDTFESIEERFRQLLQKYLHGQAVSERLYATEMRNLRRFGYGAKGFVLSLIETAIEVSGGAITSTDIQIILDFLKELLDSPIRLIEGARETIERLALEHTLIMLTKGDLFDQESKIARSGLAAFFSHVKIVAEKDDGTYKALLALAGTAPKHLVMVGNSLRSDILPAIARGTYAIHIPYSVTWKHEQSSDDPQSSSLYRRAQQITDVPLIIRRINETA